MKYIEELIALIFLLISTYAGACSLFYENYEWATAPVYEELPADDHVPGAVVLKDLKTVEYYFDEELNALTQLYTEHFKVLVNSHEAVERYNKHYIPISRVLDIVDLKVRVITRDGVREIDEIDLKDYQGEDDYSSYKYFAIDGVETGSQIEYVYTLKMRPQLEGEREFFQSDVLKYNTEFHIYCDKNMFFSTKSYNGFAPMKLDTTKENKNHYYAVIPRIEPLEPEPYAPYRSSLMRVEYKLDRMNTVNDAKLYTYEQLAGQLEAYLSVELTKKQQKSITKWMKNLKLDRASEMEKIRKVENYIKKNITITDGGYDNPEEIIEKMVASNRGVVRLYTYIFNIIGVDYLYGFTSDRENVRMDPDFESYNFLENYIFYFPGLNKFMAPTETFYRIGFVPYNWSDNYGLFIGKNDGQATENYRIIYIPPLDYFKSEDKLDIRLSIRDDFESFDMKIRRTLTGYNATFLQPILELVPESNKGAIATELLNLAGKDVELKKFDFINTDLDSIYLKPFIIEGEIETSNAFIDKAGSRYLLRIGEMIGEQVEMYQEEERKLPVENDYNREYVRTIRVEIPDGFRIRNLDDLKMNIVHKADNGDVTMAFLSDYEKEGNTITVTVKEFYKKLTYPVEEFEDFRRIINAAADFNKKVLVLEES